MAMATKWFTGYKDELSNHKPNRVIFMLKLKSFIITNGPRLTMHTGIDKCLQ